MGPLIRNFLNKKSPEGEGKPFPRPPPKSASRRNEPHSYSILLLARSALGRGMGRACPPQEGIGHRFRKFLSSPGKALVFRNRLAIWKSCFLVTGPTLYVLAAPRGYIAIPEPQHCILQIFGNQIIFLQFFGNHRTHFLLLSLSPQWTASLLLANHSSATSNCSTASRVAKQTTLHGSPCAQSASTHSVWWQSSRSMA